MKTNLIQLVPRLAAAVLAATAALKLWYLVTSPLMGPVHPDPVVGFLTHREALLAAAFFEVTLVYAILRARDPQCAGAYLLYCAACMTIYHIGLLLTRSPGCGCLGAANDLLGNDLATQISRGLLLAFWLGGLFLVLTRAPAAGKRDSCTSMPQLNPRNMLLLGLLGFFLAPSPCGSAAVQATGRFRYTYERRGRPITVTSEFDVLFDNDALKLTEAPPASPTQRYGMAGPCTNALYVSKNVLFSVIRCGDADSQLAAGFDRPAYAWELGNCGATLETCAFLTVRCDQLFPKSSDRRRLAPPWTTIAQTVGLLFEARYDWLDPGQADQELSGKMVVSEALKRECFQSALRMPVLAMYPNVMREEKNSIKAYRPGFIGGTMRFRHFTNIAGMSFPTRSEFTAFSPAATNTNTAGRSRASRKATYSVALDRFTVTSGLGDILPIKAQVITVTDMRLFDHALGVGFGRYQTNSLHTFEISALARQDFESRRQAARSKLRVEAWRRVLVAILFAAVFLGPLAIILVRHRRRSAPASTTV